MAHKVNFSIIALRAVILRTYPYILRASITIKQQGDRHNLQKKNGPMG